LTLVLPPLAWWTRWWTSHAEAGWSHPPSVAQALDDPPVEAAPLDGPQRRARPDGPRPVARRRRSTAALLDDFSVGQAHTVACLGYTTDPDIHVALNVAMKAEIVSYLLR
jgi:hypothetical protein